MAVPVLSLKGKLVLFCVVKMLGLYAVCKSVSYINRGKGVPSCFSYILISLAFLCCGFLRVFSIFLFLLLLSVCSLTSY